MLTVPSPATEKQLAQLRDWGYFNQALASERGVDVDLIALRAGWVYFNDDDAQSEDLDAWIKYAESCLNLSTSQIEEIDILLSLA